MGAQLLSALKAALSGGNMALLRDNASRGGSEGFDQLHIREVVAMVALEQDGAVGEGTRAGRFYEREGFAKVGVMKGVGRKFGRLVDIGIFQWSL